MLKKMAIAFLSIVTFGLLAAPNALAQQEILTFKTNAPLELPGKVIDAGKYDVFQLDPNDGTGPVEITKANGQAIGDFMTVPVRRKHESNSTVFKLQKEPESPARVKYFIPSDSNYGFALMYPANSTGLRQVANRNIAKTTTNG